MSNPTTIAPPPRCPHARHFSYATNEYSIDLGYGDFTEIMEQVINLLEHVEGWVDDKARDQFDALMEHLAGLRQWTGVRA